MVEIDQAELNQLRADAQRAADGREAERKRKDLWKRVQAKAAELKALRQQLAEMTGHVGAVIDPEPLPLFPGDEAADDDGLDDDPGETALPFDPDGWRAIELFYLGPCGLGGRSVRSKLVSLGITTLGALYDRVKADAAKYSDPEWWKELKGIGKAGGKEVESAWAAYQVAHTALGIPPLPVYQEQEAATNVD